MEENIQKIQENIFTLNEIANHKKKKCFLLSKQEWEEDLLRFKLSTEITEEEKEIVIKNCIDSINFIAVCCTKQIHDIEKRREEKKITLRDMEYMSSSQTARRRLIMLRYAILNVFPECEEKLDLLEEKTETKRREKKPQEENTRKIPPESIEVKSWLTLDEVCSSFKLAKNNVKDRKWRDKYDFPYHQAGGVYGTVNYNREEIEDWMKRQ